MKDTCTTSKTMHCATHQDQTEFTCLNYILEPCMHAKIAQQTYNATDLKLSKLLTYIYMYMYNT